MLHVKLAVIDNVTYLGSANFDLRSLYVNGEVMLRIEDPAFAAQMHDFCAAHESWSDAYSIESHRSRSSWLSRLRWLFAYFLMAGVDFSVARRVTLRRI
jgi:cardiolipin synthase